MRESKIEKDTCRYAVSKKKVEFHAKFKSANNRSVPDRLLTNRWGLTYYIEFKATGKKATRSQLRKHLKMNAPVYVCDSVEKGKEVVDAWSRVTRRTLLSRGIPQMHLSPVHELDEDVDPLT